MQRRIDEEGNLHLSINLENITPEDITFFNNIHSKMFNNVLQLAMRDIAIYDAVDIFKRLGFSLMTGDNKIYLRNIKTNERYHFYF